MMIHRYLMAIVVCCALVLPGRVQAASATEEVKKTVDEVVRILAEKDLKKPSNEQKRRNLLKKTIAEVFDYSEMAQRSLAQNWKERTPAEKKEFTQLFESVLENTYSNKIESYNNEKIVYGKETIDGNYAEVRSKVLTAKHDEYTLDYRLMKKNGQWVVYDVIVEGVSLVSNYRSQFTKIIRSQGYGELVKKLKARGNEFKGV